MENLQKKTFEKLKRPGVILLLKKAECMCIIRLVSVQESVQTLLPTEPISMQVILKKVHSDYTSHTEIVSLTTSSTMIAISKLVVAALKLHVCNIILSYQYSSIHSTYHCCAFFFTAQSRMPAF